MWSNIPNFLPWVSALHVTIARARGGHRRAHGAMTVGFRNFSGELYEPCRPRSSRRAPSMSFRPKAVPAARNHWRFTPRRRTLQGRFLDRLRIAQSGPEHGRGWQRSAACCCEPTDAFVGRARKIVKEDGVAVRAPPRRLSAGSRCGRCRRSGVPRAGSSGFRGPRRCGRARRASSSCRRRDRQRRSPRRRDAR